MAAILLIRVEVSSQLALKRALTLPGIASFELRPFQYRTRFDADVPLPTILWLEVTHTLDLVLPTVPHRDVGQ
jgi:hypothetical protein